MRVVMDVRKYIALGKGRPYPWMQRFDRGMPWQGLGYDVWAQQFLPQVAPMQLDHIGIVVPSLEEGLKRWEELFGYRKNSDVVVNSRQKVRVVFFPKRIP